MKCPRCAELFTRIRTAISRRDNKTAICADCGTQEALEDSGLIQRWIDQYVQSGGLAYKPYWDTTSKVWLAQAEKLGRSEPDGEDDITGVYK